MAVQPGLCGTWSETPNNKAHIDLNATVTADLEVYEVEEFLADVLNHEFDTIADDGSLKEVWQFNFLLRSFSSI